MHEFPTVTQYASPDLIHAIAYEGHNPGNDPRWAESGAADPDAYSRWCRHLCGIACLRMALLARNGHAPTLFALLDGAREYGAYVQEADTDTIHGLIYAPFADYIRDTHQLTCDVHRVLPIPGLLHHLDAGRLALVSVHKEIRRPDRPAPVKGGHLVLATGRTGNVIHLRNPSGDTDQTRTATLHLDVFAGFCAERAVAIV